MLYLLGAGFVLSYIFQELMGVYFLNRAYHFFREDDPFASIHLRNIRTSYTHPLHAINLAAVASTVNILLNTTCLVITLRRNPLRQHEFSRSRLLKMYTACSYQLWSSITASFTCFGAVFVWRTAFHVTLQTILSCTLKKSCTTSQNIINAWEGMVSLEREWSGCLKIQDFKNLTSVLKISTILDAYRSRGLSVMKCMEDNYQQRVIQALYNYLINTLICIIANVVRMIYLQLTQASKRSKVQPNTIDVTQGSKEHEKESNLHGLQKPNRHRSARASVIKLPSRFTKHFSPRRSSSWSEGTFFDQLRENQRTR